MPRPYTGFARTLAKTMHHHRLNQEELSERIGVAASNVCRWLNKSKPRVPGRKTLPAVKKALPDFASELQREWDRFKHPQLAAEAANAYGNGWSEGYAAACRDHGLLPELTTDEDRRAARAPSSPESPPPGARERVAALVAPT